MKLNQAQDLSLRNYLNEVLTYRETYEEIYDHIVSALANQDTSDSFEVAVNQVIREDFGGHDQLKRMEDTAKKSAVAEGMNKYLHYYLSYFKWPLMPFTLGVALLIYFTLARVQITDRSILIFQLIIMIPFYFRIVRFFKNRYRYGNVKTSVKENLLSKIVLMPCCVYTVMSMIYIIPMLSGYHRFWAYHNEGKELAVTTLCTITIVYFLSLIKLYRSEFTMSVTK